MPADWDLANNSVTGSLEVTGRNDFSVYGYANENASLLDYKYDWTYSETDGTNIYMASFGNALTGGGRTQWAFQYSSMPKAAVFPFARIELENSSGGTGGIAIAFENVSPDITNQYSDAFWASFRYSCAYKYVLTAVGAIYFDICTYQGVRASDNSVFEETDISQQRYAGDVTYHGEDYFAVWYNGVSERSYTYNYDYTFQVGLPIVPFADQVTLKTTLTAANGIYTAAVDIPLTSYSYTATRRTYACDPSYSWTNGSSSFTQQACWRDASTSSGKSGYGYASPSVSAIALTP